MVFVEPEVVTPLPIAIVKAPVAPLPIDICPVCAVAPPMVNVPDVNAVARETFADVFVLAIAIAVVAEVELTAGDVKVPAIAIVAVPDPMLIVPVTACPRFIPPVKVVLNIAAVPEVAVVAIVGFVPFTLNVPVEASEVAAVTAPLSVIVGVVPAVVPIVMVVVEPVVPFVPILIALVPDVVAPERMFTVPAVAVPAPPI